MISMTALFLFSRRDSALNFRDHVGVVEIEGIIADPRPVLKQLKELQTNEHTKAIVLRIDSPGGGVGPAQEIYREVKRTVRSKPVVASMGAVAASGGYYVAAACDHIMANPGTITGSISVIMEFANIETLLDKLGVSAHVLKSGKYKDAGSPFREMTAEERQLLQEFIDTVHEQFVQAVIEGRQLPAETIRAVADGRILSGQKAQEFGLLDSLGNLEDAIRLAGKEGGIKGDPEVVYAKREKFSLLEYLTGSQVVTKALDRITASAYYFGYIWIPGGGS
jgi:protease-4